MKISRILTVFLLLLAVSKVQAQNNFGGEIVSYNTFGEGMMVTRAKIVPLSGTVTNMFFYNRADQPWNNNSEWYEYDWEIRGAYPFAGWSQIRVKGQGETKLNDAPVDVSTTANLGDELLHYILIRRADRYVYDIRREFNASTYNYNSAEAHSGNSVSLLSDGPRVYQTGGALGHIPSWKQLDFSLGITAFDTKWSGSLPGGDYSREVEVDFARFYTYSDATLNTEPEWSDEFSGNSLDYGKWYTANWTFFATRFRQENVKVQDGRLFLRVNRGESYWNPTASRNSVVLVQSDSATESTQSSPENQVTPEVQAVPEFQVAPQVQVAPEVQVIPQVQVVTDVQVVTEVQMTPEVQAIPEVQVVSEVQVTSSPQMADIPTDNNQGTAVVNGSEDDVQTGSTDSVTLCILAIFGLLVAQRRRLPAH